MEVQFYLDVFVRRTVRGMETRETVLVEKGKMPDLVHSAMVVTSYK
jgi:hypothetical protein